MTRKKRHSRRKPAWAVPKKRKGGRSHEASGGGEYLAPFSRKGHARISEDELLAFIVGNGGSAEMAEILEAFELGRSYRKAMHDELQLLCKRKVLALHSDKSYSVQRKHDFVEGVLSVNPRGFGFAALAGAENSGREDIFIAARNLGTATHGDRVLLRVLTKRGKRDEGRVVRVIERGQALVVGIYRGGKPVGMVLPEDERFPFNILIRREKSCGARDGEAVVARITEYAESGARNPKGEIVEVLGDPDSLNVQTEIVIRKFQLPHLFGPAIEQQLSKVDDRVEPTSGRLDLRDVLHITIDGETARDFDDAVAVTKTAKGFQLHVSIADVSHYVQMGTPLDEEAYLRGTSVYFTTRVLPMLPERLSNNLCSLVPDQDRYAFTAILDFDSKGLLLNKRFGKSIIRSRYRMTYNLVRQILIDKDEEVRAKYQPLLSPLTQMEILARQLLARRMERGSIGFELPEAFIEVGDNDEVKDIKRIERNFAHQIVEEFMLAANEAVAKTLDDSNSRGGLYRIHETPDPLKVGEFAQFAKTMGLELPDNPGTPQWFGQVLESVKGSPQEYIVNNLLLRTMKQAKYSPENVGHFGLAASYYCHFTSPIRRYPDLMVHRALADLLARKAKTAKGKGCGDKPGAGNSVEAGEFLSKRERVAVDAEREMVDRMKVRFMADKIGECFEGIISGVSSFGLFVELVDTFISGGVAIADMKDDYYQLDDRNHRLVGKQANIYQIGNLVKVKVASVEKSRRRINFEIVEKIQ